MVAMALVTMGRPVMSGRLRGARFVMSWLVMVMALGSVAWLVVVMGWFSRRLHFCLMSLAARKSAPQPAQLASQTLPPQVGV